MAWRIKVLHSGAGHQGRKKHSQLQLSWYPQARTHSHASPKPHGPRPCLKGDPLVPTQCDSGREAGAPGSSAEVCTLTDSMFLHCCLPLLCYREVSCLLSWEHIAHRGPQGNPTVC